MTLVLRDVSKEWEELAEDCRRFAYMSRAIELQRDAIERLTDFGDFVTQCKQAAQEASEEDDANLLLAILTMLRAIRAELAMFVALKEDRVADAWNGLVLAQNAAAAAVRAHPGARGWEPYALHLHVHELNLFPKQLFMSPGMVVGHSRCSICGQHYGECAHVSGRAYMGEFCIREILEVAKLDEISLVDHPKDKRCRVFSVSGAEGRRDWLTWRLVPEDDAADTGPRASSATGS